MAPTPTSGSANTKTDPKVVDEQGILLFNLIVLTQNRTRMKESSRLLAEADESGISAAKNVVNNTQKDGLLPSICLLDTKEPETFMNLLKGDATINDMLMRLSTLELSSLVPVVRIFKVFKKPNTQKELILELPFDTTAKGIDQILASGAGRGEGAGITSFQWKQNPKYEAQVSTYKISMGLYLQNIQEFFKPRNKIEGDNNEILDVSIQDLLYQRKQWRQEKNEGTAVYNQEDYIIKVIIGWNISDEGVRAIREGRPEAEANLFVKAITQQKEVLYLTIVGHTIEFRDDGSVDLNIEFIGRADAVSNDPKESNVISAGRAYELAIQEHKAKLERDQKKLTKSVETRQKNDRWEWWAKTQKFFGSGDEKEQFFDSDLKESQETLDKAIKSSKKVKYAYLITRMMKAKHLRTFIYKEGLIDTITQLQGLTDLTDPASIYDFNQSVLKQQNLDERLRTKDQYMLEAAEVRTLDSSENGDSSSRLSQNARQSYNTLQERTQAEIITSPNELRGVGQLDVFGRKAATMEESGKAVEQFFDITQTSDFQTANVARGRKYFTFFYLSSLIEALMEPIMDTNKRNPNFLNKKMRVILGPMTIIDYGSIQESNSVYRIFEKVEGTEENREVYVKVYNGTPITINIGDIPISLKEFQRWYNENIVNKNIEQMSLNTFISSIINDLVLSALTNQVYTYAPKQKARLAVDVFTSIPNPNNERAFLANITNKWMDGGFRISQDILVPLKTRSEDAELDHDENNINYASAKDYMVIYCVNDSPYNKIGDYEDDKKKGILHLYAGEHKSTMRNIKFSRVDNPNRRADNILQNNPTGNGLSKIIREKYNVVIEMFGNTTLQVGTYIFLSPTFSSQNGALSTEKTLRELGLGGYYFVTEIDNQIESGEFRTTVRGSWAAFADGTINDGDKEFAPVDNRYVPEKGVLQ